MASGKLTAQQVVYSEPLNTRSSVQIQVAGKSNNYYWVEKIRKQRATGRHTVADIPEIQSFELFDAKLNLLKEMPATNLPGTLKQWLVAGDKGLDQIRLIPSGGKINIICSHFEPDERTGNTDRLIDSLPFTANASSFLLVRSEDQSKILFVGFENTESELTLVHALLFDSDLNLIYHRVISHELFSQPCIQDDEIGFPAESFDDLPIKLANNGEWLMASPSRISRNFSLFHASANGSHYYFKEIPISLIIKWRTLPCASTTISRK